VRESVTVLPPPRVIPLAPVLNYDALQNWDGGDLTITWLAPATAPPEIGRFIPPGFGRPSVYIYRARSINEIDPANRVAAIVVSGSSATFENLRATPGEILYAELTTGSWAVRFPVKRRSLAAPAISIQPASLAAAIGIDVSFSVTAAGPELSYQWHKDTQPIPGETGATLRLKSVQLPHAGTYAVRIFNTGGEIISQPATLTVIAPPTLTRDITEMQVLVGSPANFAVTAAGSDLRYQWTRDGAPIVGASQASLSFAAIQFNHAGSYSVTISNSAGAISSASSRLVVNPVTRLANLSVRTRVGDGRNGAPLTVGITVSSGDDGAEKPLLLRGAGPTLAAFGVSDAAAAVHISLLRDSAVVASNAGWRGLAAIAEAGSRVGAFAFANASSLDAALLESVVSAGYTARISSVGTAGVALAEIYDITPVESFAVTTPRLTNLSALTNVGIGGDLLIAGFSLVGAASKTLLVRAIGPTLGVFGVTGTLADPRLDLYLSGNATPIATNDNWGAATNAAQVAQSAAGVGAFALALESRDAVLLVTLPPGTYTAQVSGVNNTIGAALVEVYEVP